MGIESLREYVVKNNEELGVRLNYLWQRARDIHKLQNDKSEATENGRLHVKQVDKNLCRLLGGTSTEGRSHIEGFNDHELFVLSASACCHDFGKALKQYSQKNFPLRRYKHGKGSAEFIKKNFELFGLEETEADIVADIIRIHDLEGEKFRVELRTLDGDSPIGSTPIKHRKLALLLKTADILHTDATRILKNGPPLAQLKGKKRSKYIARSRIRGWSMDSRRFRIITLQLETKEQKKAIESCRKYMKGDEWESVSEHLENWVFPHELEFDIPDEDNSRKRKKKMKKNPKDKSKQGNTGGSSVPVPEGSPSTNEAVPQEVVLWLLSTFIDSEQTKLCKEFTATHAVGVALSAMAVIAMRENIQYLKDELDQRSGELRKEKDFSVGKLAEHIKVWNSIKLTLAKILNEQGSNSNGTSYDLLNQAFCKLPNGKKILREDITAIKKGIEPHIAEMAHFLNELEDEIRREHSDRYQETLKDEKLFKDRIEPILRNKGENLLDLYKKLIDVFMDVQNLWHSLGGKWRDDLRGLDKNCGSVEEK